LISHRGTPGRVITRSTIFSNTIEWRNEWVVPRTKYSLRYPRATTCSIRYARMVVLSE
jgi:hypothetical protein